MTTLNLSQSTVSRETIEFGIDAHPECSCLKLQKAPRLLSRPLPTLADSSHTTRSTLFWAEWWRTDLDLKRRAIGACQNGAAGRGPAPVSPWERRALIGALDPLKYTTSPPLFEAPVSTKQWRSPIKHAEAFSQEECAPRGTSR